MIELPLFGRATDDMIIIVYIYVCHDTSCIVDLYFAS